MPVRAFLGALKLEQYVPLFEANDIDAELLGTLTDADLATLGVASLGHRKRILAAITARHTDPSATLTAPRAAIEAPSSGATPHEAVAEGHVLHGELGRALAARGYELRDRVGQGGMGEVFLARQASVGRDVAVKVLRARSGPDDRARFTREARAIAALRHPHVVHLYDYVLAEDGGACIVMEHVSGGSLAELFARERRLSLARVIPIVVQICDALAEAHGKGIVHRDLKPANVLLTRVEGYGDFAKVLDFGIAHWRGESADGEDRLTQTGMIYGTPRYLSPEQILGTSIGPRSDLYALGVVLFEALAGETPFGGHMDAALLFKHLKEAPPPLPPDVSRPPALDDLLSRLLAKSPSLRPASAGALRKELLALLPMRAGSVVPPSATPSGAVAERRRVVVIDVSFVERARLASAPDAAHTIARRCQTVIDAVVRRHAGTVTTRSATGAQIVFGAPVARADDLSRALEVALALPVALAAVDPDLVEVRVGVAEGAAVSGALREGADGGLFVSGLPVGEAEDLRKLASPSEVRVSRGVARNTPHGIAFVLSSDGGSAIASRVEHTTAREQPFVGREQEQAQLDGVLDRAQAEGQGATIVIAGEAGMGKTRLTDRLLARGRERAMRVARTTIAEADFAGEDEVFSRLLKSLLALPEGASDLRSAVEQRLGPDVLSDDEWLALLHALGVPLSLDQGRHRDAMDPAARLASFHGMLGSVLAHEARRQPLVVVIEDLHWADASALATIEVLVGLTLASPVVLVLTTRVEEEDRWRHVLVGHEPTRLELAPLDAASARTLASLLGVDEGERRATLVDRAGGHPLLLTELVRSAGVEDDTPIPTSVQGLVHARVDRLPSADRAAIAAASVLGARLRASDLAAMIDDASYEPTALEEHRLLRRERDGGLAFVHALVRDAVYGSLVEERRRSLHARAAEVLVGSAGPVALHLDRAGSPLAAQAYVDAASADVARHALVAARRHLDRAGEVARDDVDRLAIAGASGNVELALGDVTRALGRFDDLRRLASASADVFRAEIGRASALRTANRWDDALAALDRAREVAEPGGAAEARIHQLRGGIEFARGRPDASREAHERALELATRAAATELRAEALSGLADAHYGAGRLVSAAATWASCIATARAEGLLAVEAVNLPMLAIMRVFLDEAEDARALASEAIILAKSLSRTRAEAIARGASALAANVTGHFDEALVHALRGRELTHRLRHAAFEETVLFYEAQAHIGLGQREDARDAIETALALARTHGMQFIGAALLATHARLTDDASARASSLTEGEALLAGPTLSFNRFWFWENTIETGLERGELELASRAADEIVRTAEPLARAETLAGRAHALLAERRGGDARAALVSVRARCEAASLAPLLPAIDEALDRLSDRS